MCLITLAWQADPRFELALVANRDEFHARASAPAAVAPDDPDVFGGRDLVHGGGWLQVHAAGRLAAVTNVREGLAGSPALRSRGALVHAWVRDPDAATRALPARAADTGPFNLLAWDGTRMVFASNHPQWRCGDLAPGLHRLSNADLDAPWPKAVRAEAALAEWLGRPEARRATPDVEALFATMANTREAADADLPDTGIGLELERRLSATFVLGAEYGTRCTSVVLVERDAIRFHERRFGPQGTYLGQSAQVLPRRRA
jgi:uncharacterized protein with NRDE domain